MIAYWMFWAGKFLVLDLSVIKFKSKSTRRNGLTWKKSIDTVLCTPLLGHSTWFWPIGYDHHFARMPCRIVHVSFSELREPVFAGVRIFMTFASLNESIEALILYPLTIFVFGSEVRRSVVESPIFTAIFPQTGFTPVGQNDPDNGPVPNEPKLAKLHRWIQKRLEPRLRRRFKRLLVERSLDYEDVRGEQAFQEGEISRKKENKRFL